MRHSDLVTATYVRMKLKAAHQARIDCELLHFADDISEAELLDHIRRLNHNPKVHGILVQLPLPRHINEYNITSSVANENCPCSP